MYSHCFIGLGLEAVPQWMAGKPTLRQGRTVNRDVPVTVPFAAVAALENDSNLACRGDCCKA